MCIFPQAIGSANQISPSGDSSLADLDNKVCITSDKTQEDSISTDAEVGALDAANSFHLSVPEKTMKDFLVQAFSETLESEDDVTIDQEVEEPPPPGLGDSSSHLFLTHSSKFLPLNSDQYFPKMNIYIVLALVRQKLHDEVIGEWKSMSVDFNLHKFILSWRASNKHGRPDCNKVIY